uniref:Uncharacterized protein n=1 Tax=Romanomermis culicivorax TaxID=13658 RepID=A0A915KFJ0_ROMCU
MKQDVALIGAIFNTDLNIERLSDELSEVIKSLEISLRFGIPLVYSGATRAESLLPISDSAASSPSKLITKSSFLRRLWRRLTIGGRIGGHSDDKKEKNTKLKIPRSMSCPVKNKENRSVKVDIKDLKRLKEICINLQQCLKWPSESTHKNSSGNDYISVFLQRLYPVQKINFARDG